jgi:hypothetical protein
LKPISLAIFALFADEAVVMIWPTRTQTTFSFFPEAEFQKVQHATWPQREQGKIALVYFLVAFNHRAQRSCLEFSDHHGFCFVLDTDIPDFQVFGDRELDQKEILKAKHLLLAALQDLQNQNTRLFKHHFDELAKLAKE